MDANTTAMTTAQKYSKTKYTTMATNVNCFFGYQQPPLQQKTQQNQATTKDTITNMLWLMPQRLIVVIIFWVCHYCKTMTTARTQMMMWHHAT